MGLFDFFKKKKADDPKKVSPGVIDTMSKADAITAEASKAAEAKAEEEMDELTRIALAAGVENQSEDEMDAESLINKALNAIQSDDNATAIRCFKQAMKMGNLEAKRNVARCYETGRGVGKDEPEAFKLYTQTAKAGHLVAYNNVGNCLVNGIGTPKDEQAGFEAFMTAAEQGESEAMANVAKCYMQGIGCEKNAEEGVKWFEKSAEAGNQQADFELGMTYLQIPEYREKAEEGIQRVTKSAENGIVDAMLVLAQLNDANSPRPNMGECIKWLTMAADKGDKHAQCRLGEIYLFGHGGAQRDPQKAMNYLTFSAQQNFTPAIFNMAQANLLMTNNHPQALQQGLAQLSHCVKESYPPAFMLMGQCYLEGRAVAKDNEQAVKFFTLASNHGNIQADLLLAKLYNGEIESVEFEENKEEAKHWMSVAAEKGHPVAVHDLAVMVLKDENATEEDKANATEKLRAAAKAGYTQALQTMTELGITME